MDVRQRKGRECSLDILSRRLTVKARKVVVRGRGQGWGRSLWERLKPALARFGGLFLEKLDEISLSYNNVFSVVGMPWCPALSQHFPPLNSAEDTLIPLGGSSYRG